MTPNTLCPTKKTLAIYKHLVTMAKPPKGLRVTSPGITGHVWACGRYLWATDGYGAAYAYYEAPTEFYFDDPQNVGFASGPTGDQLIFTPAEYNGRLFDPCARIRECIKMISDRKECDQDIMFDPNECKRAFALFAKLDTFPEVYIRENGLQLLAPGQAEFVLMPSKR